MSARSCPCVPQLWDTAWREADTQLSSTGLDLAWPGLLGPAWAFYRLRCVSRAHVPARPESRSGPSRSGLAAACRLPLDPPRQRPCWTGPRGLGPLHFQQRCTKCRAEGHTDVGSGQTADVNVEDRSHRFQGDTGGGGSHRTTGRQTLPAGKRADVNSGHLLVKTAPKAKTKWGERADP